MSLDRFTRREVVTVGPGASVAEVAELMTARHVGAVVIVDQQRPVGIVTDRDLTVRVLGQGAPAVAPISRVMTRDPVVVRVGSRLDDAFLKMREARVRRLPIVDDVGALVGIVALDDLLVLLAAELSSEAAAVRDNRGP